ncbi:MAG TPA: hypothetical protein VFM88_08755 [Vicinamibacteria bacterium]|nr:hypothetical protein [Vicinamibacteria bacterium]
MENVYRDSVIQQFKDLGRSLDWVENRPRDLAAAGRSLRRSRGL